MKINSLTIENFRTFYGKHKIDFSVSEKQPLTIFIGENGSGKTSILNAIFWAFTGETTKQFKESDVLINKDAAKEKGSSCSVEVRFEAEGKNYSLTRKTKEKISPYQIFLGEISTNGEFIPVSEYHVDAIIERYMPKKLANWFVFDGEAIGALHLSGDSKFKQELQDTFGFSSIKLLSSLLGEILKDYTKEQQNQIRNEALDKISADIEDVEQEIENYENNIKKLKETEGNARREIDSIQSELSRFDKVIPLQGRVAIAKQKIEELKNKLKAKTQMRNELIISASPKLLLEEKLNSLINTLHERELNQSLPEPFGTRLIDDIQKLGECICGAPIEPDSNAYRRLEELRERASTSIHTHRISLIRLQIGQYANEARSYQQSMKQILADIGMHESEIADNEQILRRIDSELSQIPDDEIKSLKHRLNAEESKKDRAIEEKGMITSRLDDKKKELTRLKEKQEAMINANSRNTNLSAQKKWFETIHGYVGAQYERQQAEVLDALNKEVSGVLFKYLTKHFVAEFDPESYAVKILDADGRRVTLSTGETNLLKFAVIAAIVGMAGSRTKISKVNWISEPITAPLIFDAPFSVVDSEYRTGIANNLTELASQLILLFDSDKWDTDLSDVLSERIGKFYTLISRAKGEQKDVVKKLTLGRETHVLNLYNSERDDSIFKEISI
jgi:DNA sulfur modification protein DndD